MALTIASDMKDGGVSSAADSYQAAKAIGLNNSDANLVREAYVTNANAGVNRSAYGSPTATASQNMGGSTQSNIFQTALNKLKSLFGK